MLKKSREAKLIKLARQARKNAHAPYSGYRVGTALLASSGKYYVGCNVENVTLTATTHAEFNAVAAAVAAGERSFAAIAVITGSDPPAFPCALCRQSLAEFDRGELEIIAVGKRGKTRRTVLSRLYPERFGPECLVVKPEL